MRILVVHNRYQIRAGEDTVFDQEVALLRQFGHPVQAWTVDNSDIRAASLTAKLALGLNTLWSRTAYQQITQHLHAFRPDIVHVHNTLPRLSPAIFYGCQRQAVPVVLTLHNYRLGCPASSFFRAGQVCEACLTGTLWNSIRYRCYRNSLLGTLTVAAMVQLHRWLGTWQDQVDGYICLNTFQRQKLIEIGLPAAKLYIKPNFCDSPPTAGAVQFGQYYLFVGRLSAEKGVKLLVEAYRRSQSTFPLVIIGTGDLQDWVIAQSQQCPAVQYLGQRSREEVLTYLKGAIALVFPSCWYECQPMIVLEALSVNIPVLASDVGVMPTLVHPHKTGLLFKANDAHALSQILANVEAAPRAWTELKAKMGNYWDAQYTPTVNYQRLLAIYETVRSQRQTLPREST
jgi:glycosyltransferase involved in cell wall biosynthesis